MSSCLNCEHLGKVYVFSTNSLTFTEAQRYCEINRGALAKDLDSSALTKLLECCPGRSFYWIGLKSVAASKCINRNSFGLQWIGSRTCSDGKSLGLNLQPVNNNECKAIKMRMRSSNVNKPKAALEFCHESIKYICQTNKARTTRATTTTTNHITRFTKTSRKISNSPTTIIPKNSSGSISSKIKTSSSNSFNSSLNVWLVIGPLAFCFLLLLLAVFFLYRKKRKNFSIKKTNFFNFLKRPANETENSDRTKIDQTYST